MINLIGKLEATYKKIDEIKEKIGSQHNAIGVRVEYKYEPFSVYLQYADKTFFNRFDDFIVEKRNDDYFPYEIKKTDGQVVHFTILDQEEYDHYVDSGVIKHE